MNIPEQTSVPSLCGKGWLLPTASAEEAGRLAARAGIPPILAQVLLGRGLDSSEAIAEFLAPPERASLPDPFLLRGMEQAVQRIREAVARGERILVHGDYDVDGVVASVLVLRALELLGHRRASLFLPHRLRDGYGLAAAAVEQAAGEGSRLVIAVDCGTSDHEVVEAFRRQGQEVVILDHHLPQGGLPQVEALINPRQPGCPYPFKELCASGLAFKLAQALFLRGGRSFHRQAFAAMAAIGTVADLVPLLGENRHIVQLGLGYLSSPANPGLRALLAASGVEPGVPARAEELGFRLAPRLNAAGRLDSAEPAARLFLTRNEEEAREIVRQLELLNGRRQRLEGRLAEEVAQLLQDEPELAAEPVVVLAGEGWHRGVIGIGASRLVERLGRPVILISLEGALGHGSGRSVAGCNLADLLAQAGDLLERFGGHAQAAGLTLRREQVPLLRQRLGVLVRSRPAAVPPPPAIRVDAQLPLESVDRALWEELQRLEPHGMGNPRPLFLDRRRRISGTPRMLGRQHLKLSWEVAGRALEAVWWRQAHLLPRLAEAGPLFDLLFRLDLDRWNGRETLRLTLVDLRPSSVGE